MKFWSEEVRQARRDFDPKPTSVVNNLTRRELEKYSVAREVVRIATDSREPSFESEITRLGYPYGQAPLDVGQRILVPWQIVARDLATSPGPKGGYLVGVDVETPLGLVAALKPLSVVLAAGARELSGLQYNCAIPRVVSGVSATWVAEGVNDVADDPVLGSLSLTARRIIAVTEMSRQLITQSPRLVDQLIVRELAAAVAAAFDAAAIGGTGGVQPVGVTNTAGIGSVSGTSITWATILDMKQKVADSNARDGNIAYVGTTAVRELLEARTKETGGGRYVWEDDRVASCPALASASVPSGALICGDWSRLIAATWADGLEITIGNTAGSYDAGRIAVRAALLCDVVVENPAGFCIAATVT